MQGGANEMPYVPCAVTIVVTLENNRVRIAVNFVSEAGNTPQRTQLETNVRIYVCMYEKKPAYVWRASTESTPWVRNNFTQGSADAYGEKR